MGNLVIKPVLWTRTGFNADPEPAFDLNADPDPGSQTNADTNPYFKCTKCWILREKYR